MIRDLDQERAYYLGGLTEEQARRLHKWLLENDKRWGYFGALKDLLDSRTLKYIGDEWKLIGYIDDSISILNVLTPDQYLVVNKLKSEKEELIDCIQMFIDALALTNLDFYEKYGFNVADKYRKATELLNKIK